MISGDTAGKTGETGRDNITIGEAERLIVEFLEGRTEAVRIMAGWARSIAAHRVWGFETPEDIVQATLLALVQNLREGRFKSGDLRAYVRRIAKNMCVTDYRKVRARGEHISLEQSTHQPAARLSGKDVERGVMLNRILERLDERCRQIIHLAYIQGLSRKEIGGRLRISEEATRVKLCRCIQNARDMLAGLGDVDAERV